MNRTTITLSLMLSFIMPHCSPDHSGEGQQPVVAESTEAEHGHDPEVSEDVRPQNLELPKHLSAVLRREMAELLGGMSVMFTHLVQGDGTAAAEIAGKIHDSFILKQELSEEDMKQLIGLLPEGFVTFDRSFHASAEKLALAARDNDLQTAIHLYGEMAQACVNCHMTYATKRFPGMAKK
jgi:hypothetical protein